MLRRKQNTGKKIALSAIIGGVAGFLGGILTAPQSGKDTRKQIANEAEDLKDNAEEQLKKANDELKSTLNDAKTKTVALSAQARQDFNQAVDKAKEAQAKASTVLKAVRAGEAEHPDLNKAVKQAKQAKTNLSKFLKS
jgi:gas vesicle protein